MEREAFLFLVFKRWRETELHMGKEYASETGRGFPVEEERDSSAETGTQSFSGDDVAPGWESACMGCGETVGSDRDNG
jgi:hypothetical protein